MLSSAVLVTDHRSFAWKYDRREHRVAVRLGSN
jgi:hypothetical protein